MGLTKPNNYSNNELNIARMSDAIGHPIRTRMLELIIQNPMITQQDLLTKIPLSSSSALKHLSKLKSSELISSSYDVHFLRLELNKEKLEELNSFIRDLQE